MKQRILGLSSGLVFRAFTGGFTLSVLVALATLPPGGSPVPDALVVILFAGGVAMHLRTILTARDRGGLKAVMREAPKGPKAAYYGFFLCGWLVVIVSILALRGQPTEVAGHYYLNDHGLLVPVSHHAYAHARDLQQRLFSVAAACFYGLGILVHWPHAQLDQPG